MCLKTTLQGLKARVEIARKGLAVKWIQYRFNQIGQQLHALEAKYEELFRESDVIEIPSTDTVVSTTGEYIMYNDDGNCTNMNCTNDGLGSTSTLPIPVPVDPPPEHKKTDEEVKSEDG